MKKCFLIHVFNFFFLNYICFWIIDCLHFQLGKVFPNCSPKCLYQFTSQQKVRLFHCPISLPTHEIARLRLTNLMHVLICIYLITRVRLSIFFFYFIFYWIIFLLFTKVIYVFWILIFCLVYVTITFSQTAAFLLVLFMGYFIKQKYYIWSVQIY